MSEQTSLRMINLGCGSRFHPAWVNVDIAPRDPAVTACDLSKRFPFADGSFDVVYHSNVLEHIRREHAPGFLRECGRILKPRGILRVAVPDLEQICRLYLENLQRSCEQQPEAAARYDWMMLEMLDQTVREHTGGAWLSIWRKTPAGGRVHHRTHRRRRPGINPRPSLPVRARRRVPQTTAISDQSQIVPPALRREAVGRRCVGVVEDRSLPPGRRGASMDV